MKTGITYFYIKVPLREIQGQLNKVGNNTTNDTFFINYNITYIL